MVKKQTFSGVHHISAAEKFSAMSGDIQKV
jgi:hypothetical protein